MKGRRINKGTGRKKYPRREQGTRKRKRREKSKNVII